jgi:hypothetical protein
MFGRAQYELVAGRGRQFAPRREQLPEIASNAGRSADELATVDRDSHLSGPLVV